MVTLASADPLVQSELVTGGKIDSSVGPGVGLRVFTVQSGIIETEDSVGSASTNGGVGRASVVAVE